MTARALIVEEDPNLIVPLQYLLEHNGYEVMTAYEGRQALEALTSFRPDVVLLDILLSGMDGFEICQHLRDLPDGTRIKIVFMTAATGVINRAKALSCGVDAYIQKPFSNQTLLDTLNRVLAAGPEEITTCPSSSAEPGVA